MEGKPGKLSILTNGIIKENPTLVLVLGTCPTLAVTTMAMNGIGMGAAATAVLVFSNILIAALKNIIPDKVRIPCYIVVIAALVTVVQLIVRAFAPEIDSALGIFLPLIVVNCIILGRAEMFAGKSGVFDSALDGVGMGIGFTLALTFIGSVRELIGSGSIFGYSIPFATNPMIIFLLAPGGFFVFGCTIALVNRLTKGGVKRKSFGCEGCPSAAACGRKQEGGCEA
ncbi:MAG: electron transport complex subunit E [Oscillospiraceae bacterium]|jgi:electron transport complex protein RnfE|nr:electron transport complex subunit E [Oscillospiraceae bacterium]